ncbi:sensor domain-containing phosphodiesterase [Cyanobium sp. FGCU-52]|nr:sensor domain-containing phosphodiesterase [Cyanobium sp. FGCU52]
MQIPATPHNEAARLLELKSFGVLDAAPEADFDDISELTRRVAGTEIAIISLVDQDRQWFKSCIGVTLDQRETPRSISFCGHTILQRDPLIIEDALQDPRFAENPLVTGDPGIRFYAGFPLISPNGYALGSLCAISRQPHRLDADQIDSLRRLATLTVQLLARVREAALLSDTENILRAERLKHSSVREGLASLEQLISRDQLLQMIELIMAMEVGSPFSVLRCRFRDYDRVNATLGGLIAENYINEGARRVIAAVPRGSSVARFSEAELVVLLPFDVAEGDVQRIAERIIGFTNQPYRSGSQLLSIGVAIGIALFQCDYDTVEAILSDTTMAVRMALRSTGSAFRFIDAEARVVARESYRLESDLREALNGRLLEAYLQPLVDLASCEPVGFEALARWPRGSEVVTPGSFLPMLSEGGFTGELDLLIIEKALAAVPLLALPIPQRPMTMSVNLSGILLEEEGLRGRLLRLIEDNPMPLGWTLQVELVEDAFQDTSAPFDRFLAELVERHVSIAIDDFGTGYSSLARLLSLPIQTVKVDRVFVNRLDKAEESPRTLLRTMLTMLSDLGLRVTAEGVETESQRAWLRNQGVDMAQGYLFHRPMPIDQAIELLQSLDYRPGAIPVDPRRLQSVRRRRRRTIWRLPFLDRRGPRS